MKDQPLSWGRIHFVTYVFSGSSKSTTIHEQIKERCTKLAKEQAPKLAYAFRFFDVLVARFRTPSGDIVRVESEPLDTSDKYYVGGRILSREEALALPQGKNLVALMDKKGLTKAIEDHLGNIKPLDDHYEILDQE